MRTELELQSDSSQHRQAAQPSQENNQRPLTCPRCESTNTKFCYYNNYNLSQPRHYCKSCRRYWTQGGTLRNIPVGGGTRKNNPKRSRTINTTTSSSSTSSSSIPVNPISSTRPVPLPISSASPCDFDLNGYINVSRGENGYGSGSFFNPLNSGVLALNGYGSGYDNMGGFEIGKAVWPLGEVSETAGDVNAISRGGDGNAWQFGIGGDDGFGETECLTNWTELAMATSSRKSVK